MPAGKPFPEVRDGPGLVAGDRPRFEVIEYVITPSVFRCGFVIRGGEYRNKAPGDIFGREGAANEPHAQDEPEFL